MKERLQKLLAQANIGSRRASEALIEQGRVRVNGKVAKLGDQADPETDTIEVDGRRLKFSSDNKIYIAVNKPKYVVTTNVGHRGDERRTIRELVPVEGHLFTIGRLDAESEGLVVLTNDGELANRLTHPRYQHTKTYRVLVQGLPTQTVLDKWQNGMMLSEEEGMTQPAYVHITKGATDLSTLKIVMTEGKKRQIRRIAQMLGHPVRRLLRTHIGLLELGSLKPGEWRTLTPREVKMLSTPAPELKLIRERKRQLRQSGAYRAHPARTAPEQAGSAPAKDAERRPPRSRKAASPGERKRTRTSNIRSTRNGTPRRPQRKRGGSNRER